MSKLGVLERISITNTVMGWYREYSGTIEAYVSGRPRVVVNPNDVLKGQKSSAAAIFWGELDRILRDIYQVPDRRRGEPCFNFSIEKDVIDIFSLCIKNTVEELKGLKPGQQMPIHDFIECFMKHFYVEFKALDDRDFGTGPSKESTPVEPVVEKPLKPIVEDKDELMSGEEVQEEGTRKAKTTNTLKLGPALHGTIACLKAGETDPVFVMILSGLRLSGGITVKVPIVCGGQKFNFPLAVSVLGACGHPWIGLTGNPTPVAIEIGRNCKTFERWYINPDEVGKYKDLADRMSAVVPKVIRSSGSVVDVPFKDEILREIEAIVYDEKKYTDSIRNWAFYNHCVNADPVKVKKVADKPKEPVKTAVETLAEVAPVEVPEPVEKVNEKIVVLEDLDQRITKARENMRIAEELRLKSEADLKAVQDKIVELKKDEKKGFWTRIFRRKD